MVYHLAQIDFLEAVCDTILPQLDDEASALKQQPKVYQIFRSPCMVPFFVLVLLR